MDIPRLFETPAALDGEGVARLLGVRPQTFYNSRRRLEALGFPPRLPGLARWSRAAVLDWVARNGREPLREAAPLNALEAEYGR